MANTKAQLEAHRWIVTKYLPTQFKQRFREDLVDLIWGGKFKFDAVSEDGTIIANITTSAAKTAKEKQSIGKFHKIKSDTLYLLNTKMPGKRMQVFTEESMREHFVREQKSGRFPPEIDLVRLKNWPRIIAQKTKAPGNLGTPDIPPGNSFSVRSYF